MAEIATCAECEQPALKASRDMREVIGPDGQSGFVPIEDWRFYCEAHDRYPLLHMLNGEIKEFRCG